MENFILDAIKESNTNISQPKYKDTNDTIDEDVLKERDSQNDENESAPRLIS